MGESKRRKKLNPSYGKVSRALRDISEIQREMFLAKYRELGRFAALVDACRDDIPFITLKTLQSPGPEDSLFRRATGTALVEALNTYNPQQEGVLLHVWDELDEMKDEITLHFQLRRLTFGQIPFDPSNLPPGSKSTADDSLAIAQSVLLGTSEPIGPVLSVESFPLDSEEASVGAVLDQRKAS